MKTINLTIEQRIAVDHCASRILAGEKLTTLGGYAGTGKTSVCSAVAERIRAANGNRPIAFVCYTGKAKIVLESKLTQAAALEPGDFVGTMHGFLTEPRFEYEKEIDDGVEIITKKVEHRDRIIGPQGFSCVVIDEASMVDEVMFRRVENLKIPILAVGDHGQLPPVKSSFNLMADPMVRLHYIHRQAQDDPIVKASIAAREEGDIPYGEQGSSFLKTRDGSVMDSLDLNDWTMICGTNKTRVQLNAYARKRLGFGAGDPRPGERVICLMNNHKAGIMNGMTGTIKNLAADGPHWFLAIVRMDGDDSDKAVKMFRHQFGKDKPCRETVREAPEVHPDDFEDLFDFGYAMTVHKAQGSEMDNVVFVEEARMRYALGEENWRRFVYTAVTRARKRLIVIGGR